MSFLVVVSEPEHAVRRLESLRGAGGEPRIAGLAELWIRHDGDGVSFGFFGTSLEGVTDALLLSRRRHGMEFAWARSLLASRGIRVRGAPEGPSQFPPTKVGQVLAFSEDGLPVPASAFASCERLAMRFDELADSLGTPFVAKLDASTGGGRGVDLVSTRAELRSWLEDNVGQRALVQSYVDVDRDYRAIIVGDRIFSYVRMKPAGEFRSNARHGAEQQPCELPRHVEDACRRAAEVLGTNPVALDLVIAPDGERFWLLEANIGFNWTNGPVSEDVARALVELLG